MTAAFWLGTFPIAGRAAELARMAEEQGWDGLAFTDSQNLVGDTFAALAIAAHVTSKITLATAATNPSTRHPAVIASAISTIQVESGGRAFLGIGRGDSALEYVGRKPTRLDDFGAGLEQIRRYLHGESIEMNGFASRIEWLKGAGLPSVPMSVAATGSRVIEIAARVADAITFAVGADVARLEAAMRVARDVREHTGLPPLRFGAYVNAVAHPDVAVARQLVRGRMRTYARFSTMFREVPLDDDFIDRFGIVGPSAYVAERVASLLQLGLDHVVVVGHALKTPPDVLAECSDRFAREVIPAVRSYAVP